VKINNNLWKMLTKLKRQQHHHHHNNPHHHHPLIYHQHQIEDLMESKANIIFIMVKNGSGVAECGTDSMTRGSAIAKTVVGHRSVNMVGHKSASMVDNFGVVKECGGSGICQHDRQRHQCKDCGGSGICPHNRRRSECKDCGGSQICPHCRYHHQWWLTDLSTQSISSPMQRLWWRR